MNAMGSEFQDVGMGWAAGRPCRCRETSVLATLLALLFGSLSSGASPAVPCPNMAGAMWAQAPCSAGALFLPLRKTKVSIEMTGGLISAKVTQQFTNDTAYPLEAVYVFPLPSRASITDMEMRIGNRVIRSVVKEREQAKQTYEQAKAEGKKTALIEEERSNIFTTSVANFMPGETVEIVLSYVEAAEFKAGEYGVCFPMVVGQRYVPAAAQTNADGSVSRIPAVADEGRLNPPLLCPGVDSGHRLSLELVVRGVPVKEIVSNTHSIRVEPMQGGAVRVTMDPELAVPDCEFHATVRLGTGEAPELALVRSDRKDGASHVLASLFPPAAGKAAAAPAAPRDVIFVIDTSGSMQGESVSQAKAGLKQCLRMLREGDRFTIVRFANDFSFFSPDLRDATAERMAAASSYVDGLAANGGTEMQKALAHALSLNRRREAMTLIVFLTDGDVGNEDSLLTLLKRQLGSARLFTFGIGSAPNEFLVRKMGEMGRGQARFIRSHEDIGAVMSDFFKTLNAPVFTDVAVSWIDDSTGDAARVQTFPSPCPDVFSERPLQVVALLPPGFRGKIRVEGKLGGEKTAFERPVPLSSGTTSPAVDALFGGEKINSLMIESMTTDDAAARSIIEAQVLAMALEYQLLCKYTARVAVEEKVERYPDGSLKTVNVPVPVPRGWTGFGATATTDPIEALKAALLAIAGLTLLYAGRKRARCAVES